MPNFIPLICFLDIGKAPHRIHWEAKVGPHGSIPFDGVPFYVVGTHIMECQHGIDRNLYQKRKHASQQEVCILLT